MALKGVSISTFIPGLLNVARICVFAFLTIYFAYSLSRFVWFVIDGPSFVENTDINTHSRRTSGLSSTAAVDVSMLARVTPFRSLGKTKSHEAIANTSSSNTPETKLDIRLNGVRADGNGSGIAFISTDSNLQKRYSVGDEIDGISGVKVERIYSDGILLSRSGRLEKLSSYEGQEGIQSLPSKIIETPKAVKLEKIETPVSDIADSATAAAAVDSQELSLQATLTHMEIKTISDWSRFQTLKDTQNGVMVFPLNATTFAKSGLKARDIIQSINGIQLGSNSDHTELLQSLESSDKAVISLTRGRQQIQLTINVLL